MQKTVFRISKMDCPSEENLIRMKLDSISGIEYLDFDIPNRQLTVFHEGQIEKIENAILNLKLGGEKLSSTHTNQKAYSQNENQRKLLWLVLSINFTFFLVELSTGVISKSMGLVADGLDMLADSLVYGLSLLAVGGTVTRKRSVAKLAGYFQITLALIGFFEVLRRFFGAELMPEILTMIWVSIFALIANGICLFLLQKSKSKEAHMKASMIFTSNDIVINTGVIIAGIMVYILQSRIPDLIIGSIVFVLVMKGAMRILKL